MKLFKILNICALTLVVFVANAQKIETYEGPFQNGLPAKATARYSYYFDEKGNKIKQGNFRYLVKEKMHDYRYLQNFQGEYSNGLKNGLWEYETKSKDYGNDAQGFSTSIEMTMKANYIKGFPEGKWEFRVFITKRKKIPADGIIQWSNADTVKDIVINLNFKHGMLVDSIQIHDNLGVMIDVLCDNNGFINGDFIVNSSKNPIKAKYTNGFKTSSYADNVEIKNAEYQFYTSNLKNKIKDFFVDTISLFDEKDCIVRYYLNDNIFNNEYFLFKYIDGDAILNTNNRGHILSVGYKGLKYNKLSVKLTDEEKKIIENINYYNSNTSNLWSEAKINSKKSPNDKLNNNRRDALQQLTKEANAYNCVVEQVKIEVVPELVIAKSISKCGNLPVLKLKISTRKDLLINLLDASKNTNLKAVKMSGR